jgi:hypothetical protein
MCRRIEEVEMNTVERELRDRHRLAGDDRPERARALAEAIALVHNERKAMEQAVLSAASSIIDNWDDWDAEAQQAAQQDQDESIWRHVLMTHIVSRLWREFGWPMHEE